MKHLLIFLSTELRRKDIHRELVELARFYKDCMEDDTVSMSGGPCNSYIVEFEGTTNTDSIGFRVEHAVMTLCGEESHVSNGYKCELTEP